MTLSVLFIDNFDSFTFNLVDEFARRDCKVTVFRNDIDAGRALALALAMPLPRLIVLSPGPGTPAEAGCCVELVRLAAGRVPMFGVCLGHQAIVEALGGTVGGAGAIVHGKASPIVHDGRGIFSGLPSPLTVGRYHSLAAVSVPRELVVRAHFGETVMAVEHLHTRIAGVQFHPESILTPLGGPLLDNVIAWAAAEERAGGSARDFLERVSAHRDLGRDESAALFGRIVRGELGEVEIAALLAALKTKGETPDEIAGAAQALRSAAMSFPRPAYKYADTCGTGGDGAYTVNISTAAAFVAAELGVPVAKHGNRSVSSRCGSADVLEACGICLQPTPETARRCLDEAGVCFLLAPHYHPGLRHVMPVRRALKTRTIFNILGPLVSPASPAWQIVGVYDPALCAPLARTLGLLGCEAGIVVHGAGLDEVAVHGPTQAALWRAGDFREIELTPGQAGLKEFPLGSLAGGAPDENAAWLRGLLAGEGTEAQNAAVAINVATLLWISGQTRDLADGAEKALAVLRSGAARPRLEQLAELSHA
jgi:anthranilate synthase/phosphoribosyltransferase